MRKRHFYFIGGGFLFFFISHFYSTHRREQIKNSPPWYVYETYKGAVNPILFITNLKYQEEYLRYYDSIRTGVKEPSFSFPLRGFPQRDPVYIIGYNEDSTLVKVVSFYNRGNWFGGSYNEGFVFPESLHESMPD